MGKLILGRDGYSTIANALLLGLMYEVAKPKGDKSFSGVSEELHKDRSVRVNLRRILDLSGDLDAHIARIPKQSWDLPKHDFENRSNRIKELANSDNHFAKICFDDIDLSSDFLKRYELRHVLENINPSDLVTPLTLLGPTRLTRILCEATIDFYHFEMAHELGLSPVEANLIGLTGVLGRVELQRPPKWHLWNSDSARQLRKETGWSSDLLSKAARHIFKPVTREFQNDVVDLDLAPLGEHLECLGESLIDGDIRVYSDFGDLGGYLCGPPFVSETTTGKLFPDYGASLKHKCYRVDADPQNFLFFIWNQVAWHAVRQGWALCIIQDGIDKGCFSWVPPEEFPILAEDNGLALAEDIGLENWSEFDERARLALNADQLWFVLARDVLEQVPELRIEKSQNVQLSKTTKNPRRYNQGFKMTDEPFIREGVQMMVTGVAKSALNAATRLVVKYGTVMVDAFEVGMIAIPTSSDPDATVNRLQRKISKAWNEYQQQS